MDFSDVWSRYHPKDVYFLKENREWLSCHKPFQGLKILSNIPLTPETICLLDGLMLSGAEVIVARTQFVRPSTENEACSLLMREGVTVWDHNQIQGMNFDIMIDCGAQLHRTITPHLGAVELTQSGTLVYKDKNPKLYPVISVDDSCVKSLETMCGTGEGVVEGFQKLTGESIKDHCFLIVGFGRVGQGACRALKKRGARVSVVDRSLEAVQFAKFQGLNSVLWNDNFSDLIGLSSVIITATGIPSVMSSLTYWRACKGKILVNAGADDEFGPEFSDKEVLNGKIPINFSLKNPTPVRYLDPIFYALQRAAMELKEKKYTPGYHPFSPSISQKIMRKWVNVHDEDIDFIYDFEIFKNEKLGLNLSY